MPKITRAGAGRPLPDRTVQPRIYARSISVPEHKDLRDAIDRALVAGETTWVLNTAGAVIAMIAPASDADRAAYRQAQESRNTEVPS